MKPVFLIIRTGKREEIAPLVKGLMWVKAQRLEGSNDTVCLWDSRKTYKSGWKC